MKPSTIIERPFLAKSKPDQPETERSPQIGCDHRPHSDRLLAGDISRLSMQVRGCRPWSRWPDRRRSDRQQVAPPGRGAIGHSAPPVAPVQRVDRGHQRLAARGRGGGGSCGRRRPCSPWRDLVATSSPPLAPCDWRPPPPPRAGARPAARRGASPCFPVRAVPLEVEEGQAAQLQDHVGIGGAQLQRRRDADGRMRSATRDDPPLAEAPPPHGRRRADERSQAWPKSPTPALPPTPPCRPMSRDPARSSGAQPRGPTQGDVVQASIRGLRPGWPSTAGRFKTPSMDAIEADSADHHLPQDTALLHRRQLTAAHGSSRQLTAGLGRSRQDTDAMIIGEAS